MTNVIIAIAKKHLDEKFGKILNIINGAKERARMKTRNNRALEG
jgi:hypothetical protein